MKILVYGAGNMGQLYAARLKTAGHEVKLLARGRRLRALRDVGIRLEEFKTGRRATVHVDTIEQLPADDVHDLVLVVLPKHCINKMLAILGENQSPNVMFFGNNAAGSRSFEKALGRHRVLLGFPGAAAIEKDKHLQYVILSRREQPTMIGELDGATSDRIVGIAKALRSADFPVYVCSNMDAWLKTHAVEIVSTASALYASGNDFEKLRHSHELMRRMVRAIREGYQVLSAHGIPLTPANRRILPWIPEPLLTALMKFKFASRAMTIKVGHAAHARDEIQTLTDEFSELALQAGRPMRALDALRQSGPIP